MNNKIIHSFFKYDKKKTICESENENLISSLIQKNDIKDLII